MINNLFRLVNHYRIRSISIIWIMNIICLSCGMKPNIKADTPTIQTSITSIPTHTNPTITKTTLPTTSPTQTYTIEPTLTDTPSPSPTPTQIMLARLKNEMAGIHSGPELIFPEIARFAKGIILEIVGINLENSWMFVKIADHQNGWINMEDVDVSINLSDLPVHDSPPTPIVTPTPLESPKIFVMKASIGGRWWWSKTECISGCLPYTIELRSFKPYEFVTFQIIEPTNGRIVQSRGVTMDSQGAGMINYNYTYGSRSTILHEYLITATGDKESVCSITFTFGE